MSSKFSSSPTLSLEIADSRLRAVLFCLLFGAVLYALCEIHQRGYPALALALVLPVTLLLSRLRRDPAVGMRLRWGQGAWTVEENRRRHPIALSRRCAMTPWVVYLAFSQLPSGPQRYFWVFVDAVSSQDWRRLRVRLTLLH